MFLPFELPTNAELQAKMQPTHACVFPNGKVMPRNAVTQLISLGLKAGPHATVQLRPGETMADAAYRHTRAEARYWGSLHL